MNHRQPFHPLTSYEPIDRVPLYYFGTWGETKARWKQEGLTHVEITARSEGSLLPEMDPDREGGMRRTRGLVNVNPISATRGEWKSYFSTVSTSTSSNWARRTAT
jgi:hypothetical protein